MTTFQQYGIEPCAYSVPVDRVQIVQRDENAWVIYDAGACLNIYDEWEIEPQPSSRTDEFKARTRMPLAEAMQRAVSFFKLKMR